jgi:lysophospholipase L1-like esterase
VRDRSLPIDSSEKLTYVALGDSTVYGLGASHSGRHYVGRLFSWLRAEYPDSRIDNEAACLATAADVLTQQIPNAIVRRPQLVTLSIGPNVMRQGHSARISPAGSRSSSSASTGRRRQP